MGFSRFKSGDQDMDFTFKFTCTSFLKDTEQGNVGDESCMDSQEWGLMDSMMMGNKMDLACKDNEYVRGVKSKSDGAFKRT